MKLKTNLDKYEKDIISNNGIVNVKLSMHISLLKSHITPMYS